MKELILSHSQLQTYKNCNKDYFHGYIRKMKPRKAYLPFIFGGALHSSLEAYYESKGKNCIRRMESAINDAYAEVDTSVMTPKEVSDLHTEKAICSGICKVYPDVYKGDFDEFEEFLIEKDFKIKFGRHAGFELSYQGKIDGLFRDAAGDWWVFETKTKAYAKDNSSYIKKVHIDNQVLGYMHGAHQILSEQSQEKPWPKGVIYNVVQKPAIRKKTSESVQDFRKRIIQEYTVNAESKEYFCRYPLQLDERAVKSWKKDMKYYLMEIAAKKAMGKKAVYPMNSGSCQRFNSLCRWLPACTTRRYNKLLYKKKEEQK